MATTCYNRIKIQGSPEKIKEIQQSFTPNGQTANAGFVFGFDKYDVPFATESKSDTAITYAFEIVFDENHQLVQSIAEKYPTVRIHHVYSESNYDHHGLYNYENGIEVNVETISQNDGTAFDEWLRENNL